jgi:hypothetical protein
MNIKWLKSGEKYPAHFLVFAELREKFGANTLFNPTFPTQKMSVCCPSVCPSIVRLSAKSGTNRTRCNPLSMVKKGVRIRVIPPVSSIL